LVCECAGSDAEPLPGHMFPEAIRALVEKARPAAVWLTHLYPHVNASEAVRTVAQSGVPTRHAHDGDMWPQGSLPLDGAWRL
jgi:ribonuclease BN (tRNA processing enzyme)